ncbi:MAG: type II toxin-antitoxin system VapC family toxin, partial [Abditibacteriales bacterium]|nr:type II toxin-antitoxin system VapC family toxin [Abditibacteriales bacterium]
EPFRKAARRLLRDSVTARVELIAPPIFEYEIESIVQRRLSNGQITVVEADAALNTITAVGVRIYTHPDMVRRARAIARQFHRERIYDALYAALAELRGCEFWTADKTFYDAVRGLCRL